MPAPAEHVAALIKKLRELPPDRVAEVEDFVDVLRARTDERRLVEAAARLSEPVLAKVWDNADDEAYDAL